MPAIDTQGMVAWRAAILTAWPRIVEHYNRQLNGRDVMKWAKKYGPVDVFDQNCKDPSPLTWFDSKQNKHLRPLHALQTANSTWKKQRRIPSDK